MRRLFVLAWASVLGLVLAGCGGTTVDKGDKGGKDTTEEASSEMKEAKVLGYATVKGKVTYNGDGELPKVATKPPTKDQTSCPSQIPQDGWYIKDPATKGVQYALVYLKAPKGYKMPKAGPDAENPAKPELELRQPQCQFEPRVLSLHPKQGLKVFNDSNPPVTHDTNLSGPLNKAQALPAGKDIVLKPSELPTSNRDPYKVACGIHQGFMSAYIWRMNHPYAVVTNEKGEYELKGVPVLDGTKMVLAVWHEKLTDRGQTKEIGPLDLKANEPATKDIAIPK